VITSATITAPTTRNTQSFEYDNYVRQGAESTSKFYDLDGEWRATQQPHDQGDGSATPRAAASPRRSRARSSASTTPECRIAERRQPAGLVDHRAWT
jgi:hypothetical protein